MRVIHIPNEGFFDIENGKKYKSIVHNKRYTDKAVANKVIATIFKLQLANVDLMLKEIFGFANQNPELMI